MIWSCQVFGSRRLLWRQPPEGHLWAHQETPSSLRWWILFRSFYLLLFDSFYSPPSTYSIKEVFQFCIPKSPAPSLPPSDASSITSPFSMETLNENVLWHKKVSYTVSAGPAAEAMLCLYQTFLGGGRLRRLWHTSQYIPSPNFPPFLSSWECERRERESARVGVKSTPRVGSPTQRGLRDQRIQFLVGSWSDFLKYHRGRHPSRGCPNEGKWRCTAPGHCGGIFQMDFI